MQHAEALPQDDWIAIVASNLQKHPSLSFLTSSHMAALAAAAPPLPGAEGAGGDVRGNRSAGAVAGGSGSGLGSSMQRASAGGRGSAAAQAPQKRESPAEADSMAHCAPLIAADGGPLRLRGHRLTAAISGDSGGGASSALGSGSSAGDDELVSLVLARQTLRIWQGTLEKVQSSFSNISHCTSDANAASDGLFAELAPNFPLATVLNSGLLRPWNPVLLLHDTAIQVTAYGHLALLRLQAALGATAARLMQQQQQQHPQQADANSSTLAATAAAPTAAAAPAASGASVPSPGSAAAGVEAAILGMVRQAVAVEPDHFKDWMAAQPALASAAGVAGVASRTVDRLKAGQLSHSVLLGAMHAQRRWNLEAMGLSACARAAESSVSRAVAAMCDGTDGAQRRCKEAVAELAAIKASALAVGGRGPGAICLVHRSLPCVIDVSLRVASLALALLSRRQRLRQRTVQQQQEQQQRRSTAPPPPKADPVSVLCTLWRALLCARMSLSEAMALPSRSMAATGGYAASVPQGPWVQRLRRRLADLDGFWRTVLPAAAATAQVVHASGLGGSLSWEWGMTARALRLGTPVSAAKGEPGRGA
mgnify:CR=1 FL=1